MGDLVLLPSEVNPAVARLQAEKLDVLAIHNHLINESPQVLYVHFEGRAECTALARSLRATLEETRTPLSATPGSPAAPTRAERAAFETIQAVLGRKGALAGRVLQVAVPRAGRIEELGMECPPPWEWRSR